MEETGTFSALVDEVMARSLRKERVADIVSYARTTVRECSVLENFQENLIEDQLIADANPFLWEKPLNLRSIVAFEYPTMLDVDGRPIKPKVSSPAERLHRDELYYYYLSGSSFVLANIDIGMLVNVAYLSYLPRLVYYQNVADRPARFDTSTETWTYHTDYSGNDALNLSGRQKVTNWLIHRWFDLIVEGTLAKLYKTINDDRASSSYALYKQQQQDLKSAERHVQLGG